MTDEEVPTRTRKAYWEQYWTEHPRSLPDRITVDTSKYSQSLYSVFRRFLKPGTPTSIVEIGGAPGLFLASLTKLHDQLSLAVIDYSDKGVAETLRLSHKFSLTIDVHQADFYSGDLSGLAKYDVAYSLGVAEHYADIDLSVQRHLDCVVDGGLVIIGLPVFLGINEWLVDRLAPRNKATWYSSVMDNRSWSHLHKRDDIEILADEYVGGFNPHVHHRLENANRRAARLLYVLLHRHVAPLWDALPGTSVINSRAFSFYYYFVARKKPH